MGWGGRSLQGMQRVRIGLTGLAFVFVLVLLAAVFGSASDERPITPTSLQQGGPGNDAGAVNAAQPAEPLAELGVAPGNPDANLAQDNRQASAGPP